jgi:hypothetical protein
MKVLLICPYLDDPTIKRNDFLPLPHYSVWQLSCEKKVTSPSC